MGRPSLANQRTAEILDAFERCIGRYGLEASTLERIAEEADMKRSILRHYVGNRDDLVLALADRVIGKYQKSLNEHLLPTENQNPVDQLLNYLFPAQPTSSAESLMVLESLITAASTSVWIRNKVKGYVDELVKRSTDLLHEAHPMPSRRDCWSVAYGVISICFNHESLTPLDLPPKYLRAARSAAQTLIASLSE